MSRVQLYHKSIQRTSSIFTFFSKAGDGNRTHVAGLEGQNSTIELHPHALIGAEGFEPPTPWSQTTYATKLRYAPTTTMIIANCLFIVKHLKSISLQCLFILFYSVLIYFSKHIHIGSQDIGPSFKNDFPSFFNGFIPQIYLIL